MLPELDDLRNEHPLSSVCITNDIVFNKLNTLKSPGPDGLNPLVLKEAAAQLCMLSRRSFDEDHLPVDWKRANIVSVFKKGSDLENYWPISSTLIFVK